jgi:hypothetical protein
MKESSLISATHLEGQEVATHWRELGMPWPWDVKLGTAYARRAPSTGTSAGTSARHHSRLPRSLNQSTTLHGERENMYMGRAMGIRACTRRSSGSSQYGDGGLVQLPSGAEQMPIRKHSGSISSLYLLWLSPEWLRPWRNHILRWKNKEEITKLICLI